MYTHCVEIRNTYNIKSIHTLNFIHFELFFKSHIIDLHFNKKDIKQVI
jgi:hypothetical protein